MSRKRYSAESVATIAQAIFGFLGVGAVAYGVWLISPCLVWIGAGVFAILVATGDMTKATKADKATHKQ